jgi:tartrate dehydrogenase/decarboxylase/D-malate dehydrogenase
MSAKYRIAVIADDGIGQEVMPEDIRVLEAAGRRFGISFQWEEFDWSCERYQRVGKMMPDDGLDRIKSHDSIFIGAVGYPDVADHVSLWGLLILIRRGFDQYANVRPVRLMPGVASPLANRKPSDIDMLIVRKNTEGEYSDISGVKDSGTENERAVQESVFTRKGIDRILRYAFEAASHRRGHVTSATKSNGIAITMPYWDERFAAMAMEFSTIKTAQGHIDILSAQFVRNPQYFGVVVGSNLLGDILSDLGPACAGTIAIAPSANINPEREFPSIFEPLRGSAPDIFEKKIANPVGQIWSGDVMLEHLQHPKATVAIVSAFETVLRSGPHNPDLGGKASTEEVGKAIASSIWGAGA